MATINTYQDLQNFLNNWVQSNGVPINLAPHGDFWNTLTEDQFVNGNVPNVTDPNTGNPLKIMIAGDPDHSNIIMALSGTPGTIFDPNTGSIGPMPPNGPSMSKDDINAIGAWIKAKGPKG